jgi:hypothetical protein
MFIFRTGLQTGCGFAGEGVAGGVGTKLLLNRLRTYKPNYEEKDRSLM